MITEPGEKPSPKFSAAVLTWTPLTFVGSTVEETFSRRPVVVVAGTVNASFGHGSRQSCPTGAVSSTSHPVTPGSGTATAAAAPHDSAASLPTPAPERLRCRAARPRAAASPECERLANPIPSLHEHPPMLNDHRTLPVVVGRQKAGRAQFEPGRSDRFGARNRLVRFRLLPALLDREFPRQCRSVRRGAAPGEARTRLRVASRVSMV